MLLTEKGIAQRDFWTFFKEAGATSMGGVPYTYEMLDRMRFTRMDLPTLRTLTQAGGKLLPDLPPPICPVVQGHGAQVRRHVWAVRATACMAYLPWEMSLDKVGAMGVAIPGGRFELIGVDGEITPSRT